MIKNLMLVLLLVLTGTATAKADQLEKYKAFADSTRRQVWAMDLPRFKYTKIPAKFKDESAVIVASYRDISVAQKSRLDAVALISLSFKTARKVVGSDMERLCIYINDEAALKKFSEFDYVTFSKRYRSGYYKEKVQRVLGVRVLKADGTVREVSTDDYVNVAEGKNDKEKSQKLAVPGLAIGDCIDIFTYVERSIQEQSLPVMAISYQDEYPIMWKRVHCVIDRDLTTQYRTLNGAPEFKASTDEDKNIVLDAEMENLDNTDPDLWYVPANHSPMVLLNIMGRKLKGEYVPSSAKTKGLQANPDPKTIQQDAWEEFDAAVNGYAGNTKLKKYCKEAIQKFPNVADRADYIFDLLCFTYLKERTTNPWLDRFTENLYLRFLNAGIKDAAFGFTTLDGNEPIDQLATYYPTTSFLYLKDGNRFYSWRPSANMAGELRTGMQGRKAVLSGNKVAQRLKLDLNMVLPESKAEDNQSIFTLNAKIANGTDMDISFEQRATGTIREALAQDIVTIKDLYDSYLDRMPEKEREPFVDNLGKSKAAAEQQKVDKMLEEQQDAMKALVIDYWDDAPKNITNCKLVSVGTSRKDPAVAFSANYAMEGIVKKAGPNLVVATGKMLGSTLKVEGHDRQRTADIDMRSARQTSWNIAIDLPSGYSVSDESLAQLRKNVTNTSGSFVTTATVSGSRLLITVTRTYLHKHYLASSWPQLLEIIDAVNEFTTVQTVLRR